MIMYARQCADLHVLPTADILVRLVVYLLPGSLNLYVQTYSCIIYSTAAIFVFNYCICRHMYVTQYIF